MAAFIKKYKRKLWRFFYLPSVNYAYVRQPAVFESVHAPDPEKLLVITSAFNDADLIALQHDSLKKFLVTPFEYFVVDNSIQEEGARQIKKYCLDHGVSYIRLPDNPGAKKDVGGTPHGLAINWTYRNVVMKYKPKMFGIWDCDLFPTKPVDIAANLKKADAWGIAIKLRPYFTPWHYPLYLWVGLAFFRTEKFAGRTPNFLPDFGVDTGGRIPLSEAHAKAFPDIVDFYASNFVQTEPGVTMRKCGDYLHFEGSGVIFLDVHSEAFNRRFTDALTEKKKWMRDFIDGKVDVSALKPVL